MIHTETLFDLRYTLLDTYLRARQAPWTALDGLDDALRALGKSLNAQDYRELRPEIWVHRTASVAKSASLAAPCIICADAEIRHCAFIRGSVLIGKSCVVGNSVELKNCILFDKVQVSHFNYVGDSILGYRAHMGAGAVTSNVKLDMTKVCVRDASGTHIPTGRMKLGALIGDYAEVGCNSVLNPGTILGRHSTVYPLSCVRGNVPEVHILKSGGELVAKKSEK